MRPGRARSAPALVERAIELQLALPPRAHLLIAGGAPFAFAAAHFATEFALHGPTRVPIGPASALVALLWLASRCLRTLYARALYRQALGRDFEGAGAWAAVRAQLVWQPLGLWLVGLAAVAVIPLAWVSACFHALTLTGSLRQSIRLAALWPKQNHFAQAVIGLCALLVFVNAWLLLLVGPPLARILFGIEAPTAPTLAFWLDPGRVASAAALTWLLIAPLGMAVQVVRAVDAESRHNGVDLLVQLRRLRARRVAAAVLLGVVLSAGGASAAAPPDAQAASPAVTLAPADLDAALDDVLQGSEYRWQLEGDPRTIVTPSWMADSFGVFARGVRAALDAIGDWMRAFGRWLRGRDPGTLGETGLPTAAPAGWRALLVLAGLGLVLAGLLFWRGRRRAAAARAQLPAAVETRPAELPPLEDYRADRLASDEWLRLAAELEATGDLRAAARAIQLALLSALARAGRVRLAAAKTNRDYARELTRGSRSAPALAEAWRATFSAVEPIWYGSHSVAAPLLAELRSHMATLEQDLEPDVARA